MVPLLTIVCIILAFMLVVNWRLAIADREYQKQSRKRIVEQLTKRGEEQQHELELLLNAFDDALIIVDEMLVIQVANRSANRICRGRKLRGKTVIQAFLNDPISNAVIEAVKDGKPNREKIVIPANSFGESDDYGESAWILDVAPLQVKTEENLTRILLRDVTSQHKTDQIKREFVANASHELRTPLAIINGYLENLIDEDMIEHPTMARKALGTMQKHGERLSALVEDMLSVSKLESGEGLSLDIKEFALGEVLEDVRDRLLPLTHEHGSKIEIVMSDDEQTLNGDKFYWDQIIFNLTENALKQNSHHKVRVKLQTEETEENILISVSDNGKGIPKVHLPFIFNRFYRVQKHHSQNQIKGTGLGLSIVKHAIESHNGSIEVESLPGEKTVFTITLPKN